MRFPKLSHGGRDFLREVVIVVVGVLIALVLEQLVTNWRDRQRAAGIEAAMNAELADHGDIYAIRVGTAGCITAKLDAIDAVLARPGASGPWRNVGRPNFFFSSRGSWNSDASDLLSRHIGTARLRIYGEAYQGMDEFTAISQEEQNLWIQLQTLERQAGPISEDRRWRLIEATAGARNANLLLSAIADQMTANIRRLGVRRNNSLAVSEMRARPLCRPLARGAA